MENAPEKFEPQPHELLMHEMYDAVVMSLSAIMHMSSHPYHYWMYLGQMEKSPKIKEMAPWTPESRAWCAATLRGVCERLNEVMNYIGDMNNAHDAVDDHGLTDKAFEQMRRALGDDDAK